MNDFVIVAATGLIATLAMTGVIALLHGRSLSTSDMVRALGSIFTRDQSKTFKFGLAAHILLGCTFAFLYVTVWSAFDFYGFRQYLLLGSLIGFAHGLFVSFLLIVSVAEHHPLAKFRRVGFGVAITYLVAHVVYGFTIGLGAGAFNPKFESVERFARQSEVRDRG